MAIVFPPIQFYPSFVLWCYICFSFKAFVYAFSLGAVAPRVSFTFPFLILIERLMACFLFTLIELTACH